MSAKVLKRRRRVGAYDLAGRGADIAESMGHAAFEIIGVARTKNPYRFRDRDLDLATRDHTAFFARIYDKEQWGHAFGLGLLAARGPNVQAEYQRAYQSEYGSSPPATSNEADLDDVGNDHYALSLGQQLQGNLFARHIDELAEHLA